MECNLILRDEEKHKRYQAWDDDEEIQIFREYLRIPSVHPDIDYRE
jgi:aminoacylase